MRLIDADKLRHELIMGHDLVGAKYVDMADTVKAIPVEYIKKWNNNYIADTMRNGRTIINQMLEDWEKEND